MMNSEKCVFDKITGNYDHDCEKCDAKFDFPYPYCCLDECREHEFCRECAVPDQVSEFSKIARIP